MQAKSKPQTRRAVLALALHEHPRYLFVADLRREVGEEADQAIFELRQAGLLHRRDDMIRPTQSALNFHRLEMS